MSYSSTGQGVANQQGLFEELNTFSAQAALFSLPQNLTTVSSFPSLVCDDDPTSLKHFSHAAAGSDVYETLLFSALISGQKQAIRDVDDCRRSSFPTAPRLLSLQRSTANFWECGDFNYCWGSKRNGIRDEEEVGSLGISAAKMKKKIKAGRKKVREPRFCFKTMSDIDVLDDGYKWRKYGQKVVNNAQHPRSYYRCTQDNCGVKKRVERLAEDPRMVLTTYEGRHVHSLDSHDSQTSSQLSHLF